MHCHLTCILICTLFFDLWRKGNKNDLKIKKATFYGCWITLFKLPLKHLKVHHVKMKVPLYADDTISLIEEDVNSLITAMGILNWFEKS